MNTSPAPPVTESPPSGVAVVIGASGGIGSAILETLASDATFSQIVAVSRLDRPVGSSHKVDSIIWCTTDHSEMSIRSICNRISELNQPVSNVFIATGVLHGEGWGPEKRVEALDPERMHHLFQVNAVIPSLWIKMLTALFNPTSQCVIAVLSARIGSIQDNKSGGWYSYRASKAALNMILKTAAVEYARRFKHIRLLAFHPGTTDTRLSQPFQASVPSEKLFSPEFVAGALMKVIQLPYPDGNLRFIDWAGEEVVW